ncbi:MAG: TetR/AcrR family transcriptional regulator [Actinobacteria bacterium]|nr:TetR/AcrR family transcriptional regulator [Actinomycetota bacterium]
MTGKGERMSGSERKRQIVQAALEIMAEQGLVGTTTRRIAEKVGVSEPALYKYFPGKKELVLEALDALGELFYETLSRGAGESGEVTERIYRMSDAYYEFVITHPDESMLLFEAVTGARDPDIRAALSDKLVGFTTILSLMFEEGKKDGVVRKDLDTTVAAWQILSLGLTLAFASLMGLNEVLTRDKALLAVREVLENIVSNASSSREHDGGRSRKESVR